MASSLNQRFQDWSHIVEARFGAWPTWKRLVVFMPVLVVLSMILVAIILGLLNVVSAGMQALAHH